MSLLFLLFISSVNAAEVLDNGEINNGNILSVDNFDEDVLETDTGNIDLSKSPSTPDLSSDTNNINGKINVGTYTYLQKLIDNSTDELILDTNITFDADYDLSPDNPYYGIINFTNGVLINKTMTINGNAFTIDAAGASRIFNITANDCVLRNTNFVNGRSTTYGGAIYSNALNTNVNNCNFTNNSAK